MVGILQNLSPVSGAASNKMFDALAQVIRALAPEVRVNAIAPSVTKTERVLSRMKTHPAIDALAKQHLVGLAEPLHIAYAALYLASPESGVVTGQILPVDSGVTIS